MELPISSPGARIDEVFYSAPMYADNLALVASSPEKLQAMSHTMPPSGVTN